MAIAVTPEFRFGEVQVHSRFAGRAFQFGALLNVARSARSMQHRDGFEVNSSQSLPFGRERFAFRAGHSLTTRAGVYRGVFAQSIRVGIMPVVVSEELDFRQFQIDFSLFGQIENLCRHPGTRVAKGIRTERQCVTLLAASAFFQEARAPGADQHWVNYTPAQMVFFPLCVA